MVDVCAQPLTRRQALGAGCITVAGAFLATRAIAQTQTIRVGTFRQNHVAAPLYWPKFAPQGIEVIVTTFGSGQDMDQQLNAGRLDFAAFSPLIGFLNAEQGSQSRIIGMAARQGAGLIVKKDSPMNTASELKGHRVGFKGPSFQYIILIRMLRDLGIDAGKDVTLVPVEWADMPLALQKGDVDAYMGSEPGPAQSVVAGLGRRLVNPYTTDVGSLNSALWASHRVLQSDPELCFMATELQRQAAAYMSPGGNNDLTVWRDLIVNQFGLSDDVFRELVGNVGAVGMLNEFWIKQIKAQGDELVKLGLLKSAPKYDEVVLTRYQKA
jgi:ABC-type amino acid transport substrate-binding protein